MPIQVNRTLRQFAKKHGYRLVVFKVQTPKGSTMNLEGCVTVPDSARVMKLVKQILKMTDKTDHE